MKYLDQYDYKIIIRLLQDGRITFSSIAKDLGITDVAVKKRYERMVAKGVIRKISVDLDFSQIGLEGEALLMLKIDPMHEEKAFMQLKEEDFVRVLYKSLGDFNIITFYLIKDMKSLLLIEKSLSKLTGVLDFKLLFISEKKYEKQNIPLSSLQVYYK